MTKWLINRFVRTPDKTNDPDVRYAYGKLAGTSGLLGNVLLFIVKLLTGLFSGSLAIVADAFNNLSDAGSSVVTLVGFRLSSRPADEEHPFGYGRAEYLSALTVAALIMVAGVELAKSAIEKILHPEPAEFSVLTLVLLVLAIGVKLWMALFYHKIGTAIRSDALIASSTDSRNDVICTGVVLLSSVFTLLTGINIDGYIGAAVALFVIWAGFSILRETVSPLLGEAPDPELVVGIRETVLSQEGIVGIHDMMVHNYGPGRCIVSLHAEVPAHEDVLKSHEVIDDVEQLLMKKYNVISCIHLDPVDTKDERVASLKALTETMLTDIDSRLSLHDFRVVFGEQHTNLIFDVVIPFGYEDRQTLSQELQRRLQTVDDRLFVVITVEHDYT